MMGPVESGGGVTEGAERVTGGSRRGQLSPGRVEH